MIRLLFLLILGVCVVIAILMAIRMIRESRIDWRGVAFIVGFVGISVFAHQQTGVGGVIDL